MLRAVGSKTLQRMHSHCLHSVILQLLSNELRALLVTTSDSRLMENNMRYRASTLVAVTLVAGCAFVTKSQRAPGAPVLPPSAYAEVLKAEPSSDAVLIGTVSAQGNGYQTSGSCESELVNEARKLGANAVLTTPAVRSGGRGPKCEGKAYLLKTK